MPLRKTELVTGEFYHVFSRSIAGFEIFRLFNDYNRFLLSMLYYNTTESNIKLCRYLSETDDPLKDLLDNQTPENRLVEICAYCIMPTHVHFLLKQLVKNGITRFMYHILKTYTHYYNKKINRKGPLWEGRFKNILVDAEEYLLHLTRYIHLNPTRSNHAARPEDWKYSSLPYNLLS